MGVSLPFLENKIKNRECALLLNITQMGGMGSCILAEGSRKKCRIRVPKTGVGGSREGHNPFKPQSATATQHLAKTYF